MFCSSSSNKKSCYSTFLVNVSSERQTTTSAGTYESDTTRDSVTKTSIEHHNNTQTAALLEPVKYVPSNSKKKKFTIKRRKLISNHRSNINLINKIFNLNCVNISKLYILIYLLLSVIISVSEQTNALILDSSTSLSSASTGISEGDESNSNSNNKNNNLIRNNKNNIDDGTLDLQIGAIFEKVASATTTKRSIPDNVFVPSLTTVPTPFLTTVR